MTYGLKYVEVENARDAYTFLVNLIDKEGELISARNEWTKEVLNTAVLIKNPRDRFITVPSLSLPFIYQELFDIFNENQPRVIHSREMVKKTMGFDNNIMFFGNENRQGNSRWSLLKVRNVLRDDKNSRKAVISYGSRRPKVHYPCLIYCHFIIRDNRLHLTIETRATEAIVAWPNDVILFTTMQEMMLGWLREFYPELEMGEFLFKTVSMHYFCDENGTRNWSQELTKDYTFKNMPFDLTHKQWVEENGVLYHYVDEYMKAGEVEDIDNGIITTLKDIQEPDVTYFKTEYFYKWALVLYYATRAKINEETIDFLKLWNEDMSQDSKAQESQQENKKGGNMSTTELRKDSFVKFIPKKKYDYRIGIFQTRLYYNIKNLRGFYIDKPLEYVMTTTGDFEVHFELVKEKEWDFNKESASLIGENMAKIHNHCYEIRDYVDLPKKNSLYDDMEEWHKIQIAETVNNRHYFLRKNIFSNIKRIDHKQVKIPLHRDFRKHNILWDGERYVLIDFDFAAHDFISIEIAAFISDMLDDEDSDKGFKLIELFIENYYKNSEIKDIIWDNVISDYLNYLCVNTFPVYLKDTMSEENFEELLEQRTDNLLRLHKYQHDIELIIEETIEKNKKNNMKK